MSLRIRILLSLLVLMLLPTYAALAGAEGTTLQFSISPISGPGGTNIAVTGAGAQTDLPVQIMLVTNGETGDGAVTVVQVDPDANGGFAANLVVPAATADGRYAVRAEQRSLQGSLLQYYWVSFSIGDVLIPETGGIPTTTLTITAVLAALLVSGLLIHGTRLALRQR
jgi:hypothetical protein